MFLSHAWVKSYFSTFLGHQRFLFKILLCAVLHTISAEPDPKKYKSETKTEDKKNLTDDERKFLREVEEKFGVKSDVSSKVKKIDAKTVSENKPATNDTQKPPFPAVIAIEIVNDTETNAKDKRTIDANLGYGYRTNNGYSYSYFGKPSQEKGKFMIYPYSQEDIPVNHNSYEQHGQDYTAGKHSPHAQTSVEIQPSQAFELVSVKDENAGYDYNPPATQLSYDNVNSQESAAYTKPAHPSTLYTTYNGEGFSGLSGKFPSIMPNYFVDPTQLINNPQYQSVGLTPEHLRTHGSHLERRVVPVLVLRIPSSYLKNPTAELYANLPNNYPLSQHLNNVNLQALVNQYFKKNGYSFAPQVTYQNPVSAAQSVVSSQQEPHHYANPYVQPAYTHADYSGVQYSAVKPVMAKYPLSYTQQKYLVPPTKAVYRQPMQQHYEYQYQYVPSTAQPQPTYYVQEQEYRAPQTADASHQYQNEQTSEHQASLQDPVTQVQYRTSQQAGSEEAKDTSAEYETPQNTVQETHQAVPSYYVSPHAETSQYEQSQEDTSAYAQQQTSQTQPDYSSSASGYYTPQKTEEKQTVSVYPSQLIHSENYQEHSNQNSAQEYVYRTQNSDATQGLSLSENYPSKDHTIATVLPFTYKQSGNPSVASVQTVSYVTPMPSAKYQSRFKIMVPQTVLKNPDSEKVSYVNSHSVSPQYYQQSQYTQESAEQEYTGSQYVPPVASKSTYTRNYYGHPKRQAKPDNKPAASGTSPSIARKQSKKTDEKKTA